MATYSRRERTTKRVEFVVPTPPPWGADWAQVMRAIHAAHAELADAGRIKPGSDAPDDLIRISPGDEDVIVSYEVETVTAEQGGLATAPRFPGGDTWEDQ